MVHLNLSTLSYSLSRLHLIYSYSLFWVIIEHLMVCVCLANVDDHEIMSCTRCGTFTEAIANEHVIPIRYDVTLWHPVIPVWSISENHWNYSQTFDILNHARHLRCQMTLWIGAWQNLNFLDHLNKYFLHLGTILGANINLSWTIWTHSV